MSCAVSSCGEARTDRCHIKTKGSGGSWDERNIINMCRRHHSEQHSIGWYAFCSKYPNIKRELDNRGWEFVFIFGQYKLAVKELKD